MTDRREEQRIDVEIRREGSGPDPFSSAVRATRMPMIITDPRQPDNPIVFANGAFLRLTGYTRDEVLGRNCRFLQGPGTNADDVAQVRDAVERRVGIEIELLNYKKSGEVFWNRLLISPVYNEDELTYFFASQYDVTRERDALRRLQRDQAELEQETERRIADLFRSEARLRFTLKAGRLGAWTLDLAMRRLVASSICKETFGRRAAEPFSYDDFEASILPEDRMRWQEAVDAAMDGRAQEFDVDLRIRTPNEDLRWVEVRGEPTLQADGTPLGMAGVTMDVTDRKRAEEHRLLLTRELNHRVKNTLATVQSIVNQSLRPGRTVEEARGLVSDRIRALSNAQNVLTDENWESASLSDLVGEVLRPFQDGGSRRLRAGGPDVRLRPRAALALSLALHELATNAAKYGALSDEAGYVVLNWSVEGLDGSKRFVMRWEEIDGPQVEPPTRTGFGSRMIERALSSEMNAVAGIDYRPSGVRFDLEAPLNELEPAADERPVAG